MQPTAAFPNKAKSLLPFFRTEAQRRRRGRRGRRKGFRTI